MNVLGKIIASFVSCAFRPRRIQVYGVAADGAHLCRALAAGIGTKQSTLLRLRGFLTALYREKPFRTTAT